MPIILTRQYLKNVGWSHNQTTFLSSEIWAQCEQVAEILSAYGYKWLHPVWTKDVLQIESKDFANVFGDPLKCCATQSLGNTDLAEVLHLSWGCVS